MAWPSSADELAAVQLTVAADAERQPLHRWDSDGLAGGCFVCFDAADRPFAGAAVVDRRLRTVEATSITGPPATDPYWPGRLALREGPILTEVLGRLGALPPLVLVDATGRDHPRRAGLALHLGAELDVPTVGVTHRPLVAVGDPPPWRSGQPSQQGATTPLTLDGEPVADWVVTRPGYRPVVAHPGWRTDRATARSVVLALSGWARTPEPIRMARREARTARARYHGNVR